MTDDERYERLRRLLVRARVRAKLTQVEVAGRLARPQSFVSKYESGERGLDVVELLDLCSVLSIKLREVASSLSSSGETESILEQWDITEAQLTQLVQENGSLRGMMLGYVAELKFRQLYLEHPDIVDFGKPDDHKRKLKGDRHISYKSRKIRIEVKSLQTKTVRFLGDGRWSGSSQVDASDRRRVTFKDGSHLETTCLLRGEFDVLAINCYAFGGDWRFVFIKNDDLPGSPFQRYTEEQRKQLLASLVKVSWPPTAPFTTDFLQLLEETRREPPKPLGILIEDAP